MSFRLLAVAVAGACVVVAAIANSLDLTERLLPVLKCRGVVPQHVLFTAYNRTQVGLTRSLPC